MEKRTQYYKQPIKSWAADDRPREKLLAKGPSALSNSELLAILIQSGTSNKTAVEVARELLDQADNSLSALVRMTIKDITRVKGLGLAKAITLMAAFELGKRRQTATLPEKPVISGSAQMGEYLRALFRDYRQEVFGVAFLNRANRVTHLEIISQGGITSTIADPRVILKKALEKEAVSIILCHNHPSGNIKPSPADEKMTQKIKSAASTIDIQVLDHIIVGEEGYFSFADNGLL
ncbi:MAG TPA: DNA repair protein RadC [Parasegetibacter sp.]